MINKISLLSQVKQNGKISDKLVYTSRVAHELPNDLRLTFSKTRKYEENLKVP